VVATPARAEVVLAHLAAEVDSSDLRAYLTNSISGTGYLSVQGPGSRALLEPLAAAELSNERLPYFRFLETVLAEVPMLVSRTGYSGELGYELYYPRDYASHVWDTMVAAGGVPCGLGALRSVRIEKKYPLYGLDVNEDTSPLEAGLAWAVDLDAEGDFIGRDALRRQHEQGLRRRLAGIRFPDLSFVPAAGDAVLVNGEQAGSITSSDRGYFLGSALGLAYLAPEVVDAEASVEIAQEGAVVAAGTVTGKPFYDPDGLRLRS
jgi:aminomethyltransferase